MKIYCLKCQKTTEYKHVGSCETTRCPLTGEEELWGQIECEECGRKFMHILAKEGGGHA